MKRALLLALCLGLMGACGERPSTPSVGSANAPATLVTGKVTGYGGKAPALARVDVYAPGRSDTPDRLETARDGSFSIRISQTGVVRLSFAGAMHSPFSIPLILAKPSGIRLDVRLAPYEWEAEIREIMVIGDFNQFSRTDGYALMVKQPDGTYATELGNLSGETLGYRLVGLIKGSTRSVPGPQFDSIASDPGGNFVSRLAIRNGRVRIVFDPASLPRGGPVGGVTFVDGNSQMARLALLDVEMRKRQEEYSRALAQFTRFGNNSRDFQYDWSRSIAELKKRLPDENDPYLRQMLFLSLLDLRHWRAKEIDAEVARQALAAIPPDSLLWELAPGYLLFETLKLAGGLAPHHEYLESVMNTHPSREFRALVLEQAYGEAMTSLALESAREYYRRLTTDFADLPAGQRVKSRPPELRIAGGKSIPEFSFVSLDDPAKIVTNETFKGKAYLIVFWATWSKASVAEMESLHRLYERYRKDGFAILSLSYDTSPDDVRRFREGRWKMPWFQGFLGRDELRAGSRAAGLFEVLDIPRVILVDANGRIAAAGDGLRGNLLAERMSRLMGR